MTSASSIFTLEASSGFVSTTSVFGSSVFTFNSITFPLRSCGSGFSKTLAGIVAICGFDLRVIFAMAFPP